MSGREGRPVMPDLYWRTRHRALMLRLIAEVEESPGIGFLELVESDSFSPAETATAKRIVADLLSFGVLQVRGSFCGARSDSRRVFVTELGAAWLLGRLLPALDDDLDGFDWAGFWAPAEGA